MSETPELATKPKNKTEKPKQWVVVAHNDDFTPIDFVIAVFHKVFKLSLDEAHAKTLEVHNKGKAIVCTAPFEVAEMKVAITMGWAKQEEHPFRVEAQPQE